MDLNDIKKNPEQIQNLITLLQGLLDSTESESDSETTHEKSVAPSKPKNTIKTKGGQRLNNKKGTKESSNNFEKMPEFRMHKDDCELDKKLSVHPPVARMRDFESLDVQCRVCGRKEHIPSALLFDTPSRYKCNNCSTQSG
jgi:hypothetical protein